MITCCGAVFWAVAWAQLVFSLVVVGLALFNVIDAAHDYRIVRDTGTNGIFRIITSSNQIRAFSKFIIGLIVAASAYTRVQWGLPYPFPAAPLFGFVILCLLFLMTGSDWYARRQVMAQRLRYNAGSAALEREELLK